VISLSRDGKIPDATSPMMDGAERQRMSAASYSGNEGERNEGYPATTLLRWSVMNARLLLDCLPSNSERLISYVSGVAL
jgi:hypothetical protein